MPIVNPTRSIRTRWLTILVALTLVGVTGTAFAQASFKRGDIDGDGCVSGADFSLWKKEFLVGVIPANAACQDAYDWGDQGDGSIDTSDFAAFFIAFLSGGFENLPAPGGITCGPDPTPDSLTCTTYTGCANMCLPGTCIGTNVGGTVLLPPDGALCEYLTPTDLHMIIDGLPPGTDIEVGVVHKDFTNITRTPGGSLGGDIEQFDSTLRLEMQGTGTLSSFSRVIELSAPVEVHTGPAGTGATQFIEADMQSIQAQLPTLLAGDPDFQTLTITAGTANGMPSPGGTFLEQDGTDFGVDSSFVVEFEIDFVGAAGGALDGMSGTTVAEVVMSTATPQSPAPVPSISNRGYMIVIGSILMLAMIFAWQSHGHRKN